MGLLVGATTQTMVISCYISPYTDPVVPSKYGWAMMTRFFFVPSQTLFGSIGSYTTVIHFANWKLWPTKLFDDKNR